MATKQLVNRHYNSTDQVFKKILSSQITGFGFKRISEVGPLNDISFLDSPCLEDYVPYRIFKVIENCAKQMCNNYGKIEESLKNLLFAFQDLSFDHSLDYLAPSSSTDNIQTSDDRPVKLASFIYQQRIVPIFVTIVTSEKLLPRETDIAITLRIKRCCVEILYKLCLCDSNIAQYLSESDDLLHYCVTLLSSPITAQKSGELVDLLIVLKKDALILESISQLRHLLETLPSSQIAYFCPAIATTISDLDMIETKATLYMQDQMKQNQASHSVRDMNQDFLLNIPGFVEKLVEFACQIPYHPRFPSITSEVDHWMKWIDDSIADDMAARNFDANLTDNESNLERLSLQFLQNPYTSPGLSQLSTDLVLRVEAIYVLGLLLVGKRRKELQKKLAESGFIHNLHMLFDQFIWKCNSGKQIHRLPGHNRDCECSPEVALKIQLLRLIHSFCDGSEYKHLLLTACEFAELQKIASKSTDRTKEKTLVALPQYCYCQGSMGLLTKVVEVLKKETSHSTFRFWLCRAIESYLRGSCTNADQTFLLRRGLMKHILTSLLKNDSQQKEIVQSGFDLLGEIIKFNIHSFVSLNEELNTTLKVKDLINILNSNLVDSNMFLRSIVLSTRYFADEVDMVVLKQCKLIAYFLDREQLLCYLIRLISIISVDTLTQENVSCLNTSLVILLLAHQGDTLEEYLTALHKMLLDSELGKGTSRLFHPNRSLLTNFRELLLFWQDHYLQKDKDCTCLEKSCRISFTYWRAVVELLVSEDSVSPLSLLHYINIDR